MATKKSKGKKPACRAKNFNRHTEALRNLFLGGARAGEEFRAEMMLPTYIYLDLVVSGKMTNGPMECFARNVCILYRIAESAKHEKLAELGSKALMYLYDASMRCYKKDMNRLVLFASELKALRDFVNQCNRFIPNAELRHVHAGIQFVDYYERKKGPICGEPDKKEDK